MFLLCLTLALAQEHPAAQRLTDREATHQVQERAPVASSDGTWVAYGLVGPGGRSEGVAAASLSGKWGQSGGEIALPGAATESYTVLGFTWADDVVVVAASIGSGTARLYYGKPGAAGGELLTSSQLGGDLEGPSVTGDRRLVFVGPRQQGVRNLHLWSAQTGKVTALTHEPTDATEPAIRADAGQLAWVREGAGADLAVADLTWDKGNPSLGEARVFGGPGDQFRPRYVGERLFHFERTDESWALHVVDGDRSRRLGGPIAPSQNGPAVRADGKQVAWVTPADGHLVVHAVDGEASSTLIPRGARDPVDPAFVDHDGHRYLVFSAFPEGESARRLFRVELPKD